MPLWTLFGLRAGKATTAWPQQARDRRARRAFSECLGSRRTNASRLRGMRRGLPDGGDHGRAAEGRRASPRRGLRPLRRLPALRRSLPDGRGRSLLRLGVRRSEPRRPRAVQRTGRAAKERDGAASRTGFRRSLHIRHVDAGSCNGCESELQALNNPFYNLHRFGIFFTPSPRFADLLLVTGPVTYAMREPLRRTYEAMPAPRWVMAVGTCAVSGGVAGGGYACGNGLEGVLPVDLYLPGCPPNPAAMIEALLMFLDRTPQRVEGGRLVE